MQTLVGDDNTLSVCHEQLHPLIFMYQTAVEGIREGQSICLSGLLAAVVLGKAKYREDLKCEWRVCA